ncbi:MAG: phosphatidate cytidylyltransferase [Agathobacter sp.]|nr:phosphatidate cytidylyltransferase [Agathobacter sp.]
MFKTRLISGIFLVIFAIGFIWAGGWCTLGVTLAISLIGMFELYRVFDFHKSILAVAGYLAAIIYFVNLKFNFVPDILVIILGLFILLMFVYVFAYPKYDAKQVMAAFFGFFYLAVMLSYVYKLRMIPEKGLYIAYLVFFCSWGCDTCAYCVGKLCHMTIGNHKMSPKLSPNKSIEGAVGGVVGAGLLTALYCSIFASKMGIGSRDIIVLSLIAGVAGLISMVGDLTASAIKRNYDIKDYGKLIPGHGGVLDRFDSMIITAPIIYYLAIYLLA